jgi:DNA-binding Lrp family transcriptional regulator
MITAIVLINAARERVNETAEGLAGLPGVSEVYSVSGEYDLVALVRVADADAMAEVVTNQMLKLAGITRTHTMVAFRAFSRHDLERLFSIGLQ